MSGFKNNRAAIEARDTKVSAALGAHFNATATFTIDGTTYTTVQLQQLLQSRTDAAHATDAAKAKWLTASAAERDLTQKTGAVLLGLKRQIVSTYGSKSQVVADFGFTPKPRKTTAKKTASAVDKRNATRAARHTMGSKQKAEISGESPAPALPPVVTPVATKPS
jgi:hypothetical protein